MEKGEYEEHNSIIGNPGDSEEIETNMRNTELIPKEFDQDELMTGTHEIRKNIQNREYPQKTEQKIQKDPSNGNGK